MVDQNNQYNLKKFVFDERQHTRMFLVLLKTNLFQISDCFLDPNFVVLLNLFG